MDDVKKPERRLRRSGRTHLSTKNQATIPAAALRAAGLKAGDELEVEAAGAGRIVLRRVDDPLQRWAGALADVWPEGALEELRDEWR